MIYTDRLPPSNNWPPLIRYPRYYSDRRLSALWFLAFGILALILSVIALIIVFAVEHSWFHDQYNGTLTQYGLWRLCFFANNTCESWFSTSGPVSVYIENRLNKSKAGINAWQALEIIFLFLTTATLIIAVASIVCYRIRHSLHYYLAILAVFCVWPAVSIGVSALFVFGFAVFNVATEPRELDWCFYVNLAAVILALIGAILLSIYDALLRKPMKTSHDDTVIETFADLNGHPAAMSPSTFVIVRRDKRKRKDPYDYPQVLRPGHYFPTAETDGRVINNVTRTDYVTTTTNQQPILPPYTSVVSTRETNTTLPVQNTQPFTSQRTVEYNQSNLVTTPSVTTIAPQTSLTTQTQSFRPPVPSYSYQPRSPSPPTTWYRTETNTINRPISSYTAETAHNYSQRDIYPTNRSHVIDRSFERTFDRKQEPRLMHYYTGYDYFATVDPSDPVLIRHHPSSARPGTAIRYGANPSYRSNDYITSTM